MYEQFGENVVAGRGERLNLTRTLNQAVVGFFVASVRASSATAAGPIQARRGLSLADPAARI